VLYLRKIAIFPKIFQMIKFIRLNNFFSFKNELIELDKQVNLLVGVNGSGKSNLLKAIRLLKVGVEGNANGAALFELIVNQWGGFDNIYCKAETDSDENIPIGLEFTLDKDVLTAYANGLMEFEHDIIYKIYLIKKPSTDNYYIYENIRTFDGYTYLNFNNGEVEITTMENGHGSEVDYDEENTHELILSSMSDFDTDRYSHLIAIKNAIKDISIYDYIDTSPNSKLRRAMSATSSVKRLLPDGRNLSQIINFIKINHKKNYRLILEKLKDVNEMFEGFDFNFMGSGQFELMLSEQGLDSAVHITHVSDGTLRYLCLLAILLNPNRGSLVCIDEPEAGLHPDMIYNISRAMQEASGETCFLIATHSENVLNNFNVENVRVFEKEIDNTTTVKTYHEADFEGWYEEFSPGNMWRTGDLGGKRW